MTSIDVYKLVKELEKREFSADLLIRDIIATVRVMNIERDFFVELGFIREGVTLKFKLEKIWVVTWRDAKDTVSLLRKVLEAVENATKDQA